MHRHLTLALALLALVAVSPLTVGQAFSQDTAVPAAPCEPPDIPETFSTQDEVDAFMARADAYKECIDAFVAEQEALMKAHQEAATRAVKQWNDFADQVNESQEAVTEGQ
ncbi:MAG: hypothetical protein ACOCVU_07200 [Desulfohalobiaceae bacterium]